MTGETGQLQRLTDQQVSARLAAYNPGGSLDSDLQLLRDKAGDLIVAEFREQFGSEAAATMKAHYAGKVDASWIQAVAEYGRRIFQEKTSVPQYIAGRDQLITRVVAGMFDRFADDVDTLRTCVSAFQRLTTFETDIILAQVSLLEAIEAADQRGRESEHFERRVAELVLASTEQSRRACADGLSATIAATRLR